METIEPQLTFSESLSKYDNWSATEVCDNDLDLVASSPFFDFNPFEESLIGQKRKSNHFSDTKSSLNPWDGMDNFFSCLEETNPHCTFDDNISKTSETCLKKLDEPKHQIVTSSPETVEMFPPELYSLNSSLPKPEPFLNHTTLQQEFSSSPRKIRKLNHSDSHIPQMKENDSGSDSPPKRHLTESAPTLPTSPLVPLVPVTPMSTSVSELRETIFSLKGDSQQMLKQSLHRLSTHGNALYSLFTNPQPLRLTADQTIALSHDIFTLQLILGIPMPPSNYLFTQDQQTYLDPSTLQYYPTPSYYPYPTPAHQQYYCVNPNTPM